LKKDLNTGDLVDPENRLFMSGFPKSSSKEELKKVLEQFGELKYINLIEDNFNPGFNRGFCFFEYRIKSDINKAIEGLNKISFGESRLKVHKANSDNKNMSIASKIKEEHNEFIKNQNIDKSKAKDFSYIKDLANKDSNLDQGIMNFKFTDKSQVSSSLEFDLPSLYAYTPSRVIQMINVLTPEDLMDDYEYRDILDDIRFEACKYGAILNIEIPRPCKQTGLACPAVGKVFIKYQNIASAKKAQYKISGLKYNRRTLVCSFYPENLFDLRDFIINERPVIL
jgi:splicing factor U2AF subunit